MVHWRTAKHPFTSSDNALATKLEYHIFFFIEKYKHKPSFSCAAAIFRAAAEIIKERENETRYKQ
jgi:hypothetical protein